MCVQAYTYIDSTRCNDIMIGSNGEQLGEVIEVLIQMTVHKN